MKLFLDANALFTSAHNPDGKAAFVVELAEEGHWEVVTSSLAIEEARQNLEAKFPAAVTALDGLLETVARVPTAFRRVVSDRSAEKGRSHFPFGVGRSLYPPSDRRLEGLRAIHERSQADVGHRHTNRC